MNVKKLLIATVIVGVVLNVFDFVVHGMLLRGTYESLPDLFAQNDSVAGFVIGDFVFALVFVWFYDRVRSSFGEGTANGAKLGFYVGVLLGFPAQLFAPMMFVGFPYALGWEWVAVTILVGVLAGATAGAVYGTEARAPAV
jgi:hypothetical protein